MKTTRRILALLVACLLWAGAAHAAEAAKPASSGMVSREGENTLLVDKKTKEEEAARAKRRAAYKLPAWSKEDKEMEGTAGTVTGRLSGLSRHGLGVEQPLSDGASSDLWFQLAQETKLKGVKAASDLKEGDKVSVKYKEAKDKSKRLTLEVTFLERPEPKPIVPDAPEPEAAEGGPGGAP